MVFLWYEAARFADEGLQPGTFFRMGDLFKADLCFTVNDGELNQPKWNIICIVYIYTHMHMHIYIYTHTYIHTYIYVYIYVYNYTYI